MSSASWSLVVPVKRLALAKSRLADLAGALREELALAFALDTVAAAMACRSVASVVVVTDEGVAREQAEALGATVVEDRPDAGLNPALRHGAQYAGEAHGVAALSADLPALRPEVLELALLLAARHRWSFAPDPAGTGSTFYAARERTDFEPAFGPGSAARHRAAGAAALEDPALATLRRDVDTAQDLRSAVQLGVGSRTAAVLERLGLDRQPDAAPGDGG